MKLSLYFLVLQLIFIPPAFSSMESPSKEEYKQCIFFKATEGSRYAAADVVKELSLRSNLSFVNVYAPIKRCIQMMAAGEIDFMLTVRVDEYTSKHMNFLVVTEGVTNIIFYTRKSDGNWLNEYADLKGKTVGTSAGFGYFEKFDLDDSVKKFKANDTKQLPKLLEAGRIHAYVTYDALVGVAEGYSRISQAPYSVGVKMSRLAIGKGSPLQVHRSLIEDNIKSIIDDGTWDRIMFKHVPEYKEKPSR